MSKGARYVIRLDDRIMEVSAPRLLRTFEALIDELDQGAAERLEIELWTPIPRRGRPRAT